MNKLAISTVLSLLMTCFLVEETNATTRIIGHHGEDISIDHNILTQMVQNFNQSEMRRNQYYNPEQIL